MTMSTNEPIDAARMFLGQPLKPFTPQRQHVAMMLGMRYGMISEEDQVKMNVTVPVENPKKGQPKTETVEIFVYRQMFQDSLILVWLCLQKDSRISKAERQPDDAKSEMWNWAKANAVNIGTERADICNTLFMATVGEIQAAKTHPEAKNPGDGNGNDDDED
jgi:hypothetical protein